MEEWLQEVERLKTKAREFMGVFGRMQELEPIARMDSAASLRWDKLMGMALAVRDRISYVTGLIDNVFSWFNSNGSTPPQTIQGLGQLGIAWLPLAVVAGAIAYIVSWLTDAYIEVEQLETVKSLIDQGVQPADAYRLAREQDKGIIGSFFEGLQNNFLLFAGLGLAAYYLPRYIKKGKR